MSGVYSQFLAKSYSTLFLHLPMADRHLFGYFFFFLNPKRKTLDRSSHSRVAKRVTKYEEHGFTHGRECRPLPWPNNEEHGWTHGKEHHFLGLVTKSPVGST
jgi:hypothetical protein